MSVFWLRAESKATRDDRFGGSVLGGPWCAEPAVGLLARSAPRGLRPLAKQSAETPRDALEDASHLDGVNCYKDSFAESVTPAAKLSRLFTDRVLRSRISMVTLPLEITKP